MNKDEINSARTLHDKTKEEELNKAKSSSKQNKKCCKGEGKEHSDCGYHEEKHCGCHDNLDETQKQYQELFNSLTAALDSAEKQLKATRDEMLNNQRIAVSYKKDLERYKERNKNIETDAKNNAVENVAAELLPVLDQFETALNASADGADKKGYQMIFAGLEKAIENLGITEINALGQPFDTNIHNAVSKIAVKDKAKDGVVTAVYQKGYKLNSTGKIIRYAMVEIGEYTK